MKKSASTPKLGLLLWIGFGGPLIYAEWIWYRAKWNPDINRQILGDALIHIAVAIAVMLISVALIAAYPIIRCWQKNKSKK